MKITLHGPVSIELNRGDIEWILRPIPGTKLVCKNGVVWLTQTGNGVDHIMMPGDEYTAQMRGKLLFQAMSDAVVHIG
jgi:hypothetical protein